MEKEKKEINESHEEEFVEHHPWYKGPLKIIVGLFLLLLIILWMIPFYGIKQNPEPTYIPTLEELNLPQLAIPDLPDNSANNIKTYVQVNSEIKQIADKIVSLSCEQTHKTCNAKAIFYFVQQNFNYLNDPLAFEYYKTPQESLRSNTGDCDDSSILTASLLQSIGFQTRFVFVPQHVYIQVRIPDAISSYKDEQDWINLDPTCQDCEFGEISYTYANSEKIYLE